MEVTEGVEPGPVLVTGALGLVGSAVVRHLAAEGRDVVATDLEPPADSTTAGWLTDLETVRPHWADLTDSDEVQKLVDAVAPSVIVHLAAMIPPQCYRRPAIAWAVNVGATASLLRAAAALPTPPRFVQASSVAVYGPRNPHRVDQLLTPDTPVQPGATDIYGAHKAEAEQLVRSSSLEWVVLRLGGVLRIEPQLDRNPDTRYFEASLPEDGRIQTVDVRDVAHAFAAATTTDHVREVFLIGGDATHRLVQRDIRDGITAAMGLVNGMPPGRPGDPAVDENWYATDWMDTSRSQSALGFQHHSYPDTLAEVRARTGRPRYYLLRILAPLVRRRMRRQSPYHDAPGGYADPWGIIATRLS